MIPSHQFSRKFVPVSKLAPGDFVLLLSHDTKRIYEQFQVVSLQPQKDGFVRVTLCGKFEDLTHEFSVPYSPDSGFFVVNYSRKVKRKSSKSLQKRIQRLEVLLGFFHNYFLGIPEYDTGVVCNDDPVNPVTAKSVLLSSISKKQ